MSIDRTSTTAVLTSEKPSASTPIASRAHSKDAPSAFELALRGHEPAKPVVAKTADNAAVAIAKKTKPVEHRKEDQHQATAAQAAPLAAKAQAPVGFDATLAHPEEQKQLDGAPIDAVDARATPRDEAGEASAREAAAPTARALENEGEGNVSADLMKGFEPAEGSHENISAAKPETKTDAEIETKLANESNSARVEQSTADDQAAQADATAKPPEDMAQAILALVDQTNTSTPTRDDRSTRIEDDMRAHATAHDPIAPTVQVPGDAPAPVEAVKATHEVDWHGLADRLVDVGAGSIEGHRARLVMGSGDDRVVMTISTAAHRVSIEVEQNTAAGHAMAEALRNGQAELNEALGRHGLELSQPGAHDAMPRSSQPDNDRQARRSGAVSAPERASNDSTTETSPARHPHRVVVVA